MVEAVEAPAPDRYQLTSADESTGVLKYEDGAFRTWMPPETPEYVQWKADGGIPEPMPPPPLRPSDAVVVSETLRTTDDQPHEIYRFPCSELTIQQGNLVIFGADAGTFAVKTMEGRFVWKRLTANAIVLPITVVSDIHDTAAAAWAPNATPQGADVVFTVKGAAGRTVDWLLTGLIQTFTPGEMML